MELQGNLWQNLWYMFQYVAYYKLMAVHFASLFLLVQIKAYYILQILLHHYKVYNSEHAYVTRNVQLCLLFASMPDFKCSNPGVR
jgi:hypothetical protein